MKIQYLVTVVKKSADEIKNIVKRLNISGCILVGNQMMDIDDTYEMSCFGCTIKVFNMSSKGVSKNRNFLILNSSADFITFLDDDMYCVKGVQDKVEDLVSTSKYNSVRFNVISDNLGRPIKQIRKEGFIKFKHLSSCGVCGIFYKRDFLIKNNLFFNEDVGPGTIINHGEDALFNKQFFEKSKVYCFPLVAFHAIQADSTWHNENRDLETELFAHGYVYYLLYKHYSNIRSVLFLASHMRCYPKGTKYSSLRRYMKNGIKKAKEIYQ